MRKFRLTLLFITLLGAFSACNKDDDAAPVTKADMLAGKIWRLSEHTVNPGRQTQDGQIITNLYQFFGSTYQDNIAVFNRNPNTYTMEEGATKFDPTEDQVFDTGTWLLNSDETVLVLNSTSGQILSNGQVFNSTNFNIVTLDNTTFSYSYSYRLQQNGPVYTETITYTVQ